MERIGCFTFIAIALSVLTLAALSLLSQNFFLLHEGTLLLIQTR